MLRVAALLLFSIFTTIVHADAMDDADNAWSAGKSWPEHWGMITYPYHEAWNTVFIGFVNKVYAKDEAADTWLKDIPYARQAGAAIEICMMKRGLLQLASWCKPAVVDPEIINTLNENDVVAFFYPHHGTKRFSRGPGSDARTTLRIFQKLSASGDDTCWVREALVFTRPIANVCFKKIDVSLVEHLLTRDFGPRGGGKVVGPDTAFTVGTAKQNVVEAKVEPNVTSSNKNSATANLDVAEAQDSPVTQNQDSKPDEK